MWRSARSEHRINVRIEEVMEKGKKKYTQRHNIFIGHRASCIAFICSNEAEAKSAERKKKSRTNEKKKLKRKTKIAAQEWTATQTV